MIVYITSEEPKTRAKVQKQWDEGMEFPTHDDYPRPDGACRVSKTSVDPGARVLYIRGLTRERIT